jgi:hypothetical protein
VRAVMTVTLESPIVGRFVLVKLACIKRKGPESAVVDVFARYLSIQYTLLSSICQLYKDRRRAVREGQGIKVRESAVYNPFNIIFLMMFSPCQCVHRTKAVLQKKVKE